MVRGFMESKVNRVFLGGTCNESTWRDDLIKGLDVEYFDPVVKDWTPADQESEIAEREMCDRLLYVLTPKMTGVYSVAEVIDDSNKRPQRTIFCYLVEDDKKKFDEGQIKSLDMVGKMVEINGGTWAKSLEEVRNILNGDING